MMLIGELLQGGEKWCNRLQEIAVPTLIIHGTEDCVLPYAYSWHCKQRSRRRYSYHCPEKDTNCIATIGLLFLWRSGNKLYYREAQPNNPAGEDYREILVGLQKLFAAA